MSEHEINTKEQYIEFFRNNGFNCFPIPKLTKEADYRYKASQTIRDQTITDEENYGVITIQGSGTVIIDLDNKEQYRKFAEENIQNGFMIIETGKGWHIPVKGLSGIISKVELFDYKIQDEKIIEIQGHDHYVIGVESIVDHDELKRKVTYKNKGTLTIWDAKGKDFHQLIDALCKSCNVVPRQKSSRSSYKNMRKRFLEGKPPTKGQSNDYFYQAALQCNTDEVTQDEAIEKIQKVYDIWTKTQQYSGRPFSNIERKIQEVYDNDSKISSGRPLSKNLEFAHQTSLRIIEEREIYSDIDSLTIYENENGFLEEINNSLQRELQQKYTNMTSSEFNDVVFKICGLAEKLPDTDKNIVRFPNGAFDKKLKQIVDVDNIADMGFRDYNYLEKSKENEPTQFIKIMFGDVPKHQHTRIKAGLRSIFQSYVDPHISVIYGKSGVGKSTPLEILCEVLGTQYALSVELEQIENDSFIKAHIKGKYLVNIQDLPDTYKSFTKIKNMTGEKIKSERGFHQDMTTFDNKIKIWGSANYLFEIPEKDKDSMFTRRLSLVHNTKEDAYAEDPNLLER